jgi:hypothetical protein
MFSHLTADTEQELLAFAYSVGLPKKWLQSSGASRFHFDVVGAWLGRVVRAGAQVITMGEFMERIRNRLGQAIAQESTDNANSLPV